MGFNKSASASYSRMSFGGTDISAVIGGTVIGQLQAISYSVQRERGPVYVMGHGPDPIAFARGKRAVAGSLIFITIDQSSLLSAFNSTQVTGDGPGTFYAKKTEVRYATQPTDNFGTDAAFVNGETAAVPGTTDGVVASSGAAPTSFITPSKAWYADQLPPFDVFLSAGNEMGDVMKKEVIGVEILNEGSGVSVDDLVLEEQYTFVARFVSPWIPLQYQGQAYTPQP